MRFARRILFTVLFLNTVFFSPVSHESTLQRDIRAELRVFTEWLKANHALGYIGEFGWPGGAGSGSDEWNGVADTWLKDIDAAHLWGTAWATGEWWQSDYPLGVYQHGTAESTVYRLNTQAPVLESHLSTASYLRGINVSGGSFTAPSTESYSTFSNANPGLYDRDYHYDGQRTFDFLASRGMRIVRIECRWERLQPKLDGPLDIAELTRLKAVIARANAVHLAVILDVHNYGAYYLFDGTQGVRRALGSPELSFDSFANLWDRLSVAFRDDPGVLAYDLMNEPANLGGPDNEASRVWETASQHAVDAIRLNNDYKLIMIPGYRWSGVQQWSMIHPSAWIRDPAYNHRYEAHHYWDRDHSGSYLHSFTDEEAYAKVRR